MVLVRHGQTQWNASHRFQGQTDIPLSAFGEAQAHALGRALRHERIDAIYTSDLCRAAQTARHIATPHSLTAVPDARLREFAFGQWEGLTWDEIVARFPEAAGTDLLSVIDYRPPGGETLDIVRRRVGAFLHHLPKNDATVVVVTHAGALHAALSELFGDDYFEWKVRLMPASITRVRLAPHRSPELIALNLQDHLPVESAS